jgi:cytochrome c556
MKQFALRPRFWIAGAMSIAFLPGSLGSARWRSARDQHRHGEGRHLARKLLSGHQRNMDDLDIMVETNKFDVPHGAMHADVISVLLLSFPHLFPPASNEWKPGVDKDPGTDTFASPDIWTRYADFYKRNADASKTAYNASRARNAEEFKKYAIELRAACDGCHAAYQKKD